MINKTIDNLVANMGEISFFTATTLGAAISKGDLTSPLFVIPATCQLMSGLYNQVKKCSSQKLADSLKDYSPKQKSIKDSGDVLYGLAAEGGKVALAGAIGYYVLSQIL